MKKYETTKLFYNKYAYRLQICNSLAVCFREKNLSFARQVLDKLQHQFENKEPLEFRLGLRGRPVSESYFKDAKRLLTVFSNMEDYKLRVEQNYINVYANDEDWINRVKNSIQTDHSIISLYKPGNYKLDANTIIVDKDNGFQYKITLGNKSGSPEFALWADNNPKLVKVGPVLREECLNSGWVSGCYFYARDDKTLQLVALIINNIRRIDKLVVKSNIDK